MSEKPTPAARNAGPGDGPGPTADADPGARAVPPAPGERPTRITVAAALSGLQGAAIAVWGATMLLLTFTGDPDGLVQALTGAVTVLALAVLPLAAGHGLWRLRRWSRGPAVLTQMLALPAAWYMVQTGGGWLVAAVPLAVTAAVILGCLMSPAAAEALGVTPPGTAAAGEPGGAADRADRD
ncbi:hypothetical protein [Streptomyces lonarensis]|uniref:hypothetical protein n=1 Tax=Streptomyces lonarensis TaxID=700599 RepID=UPI001ADDCB72|nr:hypothetical protein [Streptomyces lonarensis]